jgi:hypothetical protein
VLIRVLDRRPIVAVALGIGLALQMFGLALPADAGAVCTYVADPEDAQFVGSEINLTGSFSDHANAQFGIGFFPEEPQPGQFLPVEKLGDNGTTNNAGNFDETRTIPGDMEPGVYRLAAYETGGLLISEPPGCYDDYTVLLVIVVDPVTTTTTAAVTTTEAETTTSLQETTTSAEETTTSAEETTTTEDLLAGDEVDGGGIALWLILLIVLLVGAVFGLFGYIVGQRRRSQTASSAYEPPPPAA